MAEYQLPDGSMFPVLNYNEAARSYARSGSPLLPFNWQRSYFEGPLNKTNTPDNSPFRPNYVVAPASAQEQEGDDAAVREKIAERAKAQQNARRSQPFATGNPMLNHGASGAYHAAIGAAQQGNALGDMISQTMGAHQDENDSRVAQMREMRRMEHEKELKRMELDAILARLSQAQQTGPQPRASFRGGAIY